MPAISETIEHGKTGFRCHTLDHFIWAAQNVNKLDPAYIRRRALERYSIDTVRYKYDEYFSMLADLWKAGWYEEHPERKELDWLVRGKIHKFPPLATAREPNNHTSGWQNNPKSTAISKSCDIQQPLR